MSTDNMTPDERAARDSIAHRLGLLLLGASIDEARVAERVIGRFLGIGAENYGRLRIERDPRDFDHETGDELADSLIYVAVQWLKREARRLAPLREALDREWLDLEVAGKVERVAAIGDPYRDNLESYRASLDGVTNLDAEIRAGFQRDERD